jgi:hypothetical protein
MLVLLAISLAAIVYGLKTGWDARTRVEQSEARLQASDARATRLRDELEGLRSELEVLVRDRLPGLDKLIFDREIAINTEYVRHLKFMTPEAEQGPYRLRMVLHNRSPTYVEPNVQVMLFDRVGLQIGGADLAMNDAILIPDEVRAVEAEIDPLAERTPVYYLLRID